MKNYCRETRKQSNESSVKLDKEHERYLIIDKTHAPTLELYTDSDWAGDTQGRKSTNGTFFFIR